MTTPIININIDKSTWDCECCGSIYDSSINVVFPEGKVLAGYHDGHFGYSTWDGHVSAAYFWILESLGFQIILNGDLVNMPCYNGLDENDYPIMEEAFIGPLLPIFITSELSDFESIYGDEAYRYNIETKVTVKLLTQELPIIKENKNGLQEEDWDTIYKELILPYYLIVLNETEHVEEQSYEDSWDEDE